MPRPGTRPYECVKRTWHSETHQLIRGSMVQQILRLAIQTHSSATKKNKEWRDKILIVIVKAEEMMYSKANSENEYMNPETLWDRVNDAIDTIIRRDESTETGELLPPFVEAALNLGCSPVRYSRSQQHCNPRTYLTPRAPQHVSLAPRIFDEDIGGKGDGLQDMKRTNEKSFLAECDLSLRSGLFSDPRVQVEKDSIFETGDVGQSSPCDGGKVNEVFQQKSKEFCFSLEGTVNGHFEPIS
ncbi:uncharacterized protein [Gossypium hirsutum]|uniref:Uncharacterized protein isoform X2 n=1 Tax=Gossypium hirsutum TaxID=3635 RepID=A0ABM3BE82_GOSHI|nr:uncharacterized protein LOC121225222 isoform X2 [Gossypium hirsutum]